MDLVKVQLSLPLFPGRTHNLGPSPSTDELPFHYYLGTIAFEFLDGQGFAVETRGGPQATALFTLLLFSSVSSSLVVTRWREDLAVLCLLGSQQLFQSKTQICAANTLSFIKANTACKASQAVEASKCLKEDVVSDLSGSPHSGIRNVHFS